jgi:hypothetical protein
VIVEATAITAATEKSSFLGNMQCFIIVYYENKSLFCEKYAMV